MHSFDCGSVVRYFAGSSRLPILLIVRAGESPKLAGTNVPYADPPISQTIDLYGGNRAELGAGRIGGCMNYHV